MSFNLSTKGASVGSLIGRGIVLLIIGVLLAVFTYGGMFTLSILSGIFLIVLGITLIFGCFEFDGKGGRVLSIILGILVIAIGIYALAQPLVFANVASYFLGVIAFVAGIYELIIGITDKDSCYNRPLQIVLGILGILFGIFVFAWPWLGDFVTSLLGPAFGVTFILGVFLFIYGAILLIQGIVLHSKNKKAAAVKN